MTTDGKDSRTSDYLLGCKDEELARLEQQHELWSAGARALWQRAGFGEGQSLLDLGCGPGFSTLDLARLVGPGGSVLGVDASPKFLEFLTSQAEAHGLVNASALQADAHELELAAETFDGVYSRWLFCFLERPEQVVARVAPALRTGGRFAINDYFNYRAFTFGPRNAALDKVVEAVQICWRDRGGDLDIGGRLPAMLAGHGCEVCEIRPIAHVARPGSPLWNWPRQFFRGFLPTLEEGGWITHDDSAAFWRAWEIADRNPWSFIYLPPMVDIIAIKR